MEYCEGGDMRTMLKKCKQNRDYIAEDVIWKIFTQIILALSECHNRKSGKIMHRDLKPANIFLDSENNVKLGDFGLSRVMGDQSIFATTHVGTPYYMSPEQINESQYDEKSDIWSAGCLLYEIAALRPPFEATNHLSLAIKIKAGKFDRLPQRYSEDLQKVIQVMLNMDPRGRPSADDLLKIPQLAMRVQERKLREKLGQVKQIEEEIKKKEEELKTLENSLTLREKKLSQLETKRCESDKQVSCHEKENILRPRLSLGGNLGDIRSKKAPLMPYSGRKENSVRDRDRSFEIVNGMKNMRGNSREVRIPTGNMRNLTFVAKNVNSSFTNVNSSFTNVNSSFTSVNSSFTNINRSFTGKYEGYNLLNSRKVLSDIPSYPY